jgi:hypothetical protein
MSHEAGLGSIDLLSCCCCTPAELMPASPPGEGRLSSFELIPLMVQRLLFLLLGDPPALAVLWIEVDEPLGARPAYCEVEVEGRTKPGGGPSRITSSRVMVCCLLVGGASSSSSSSSVEAASGEAAVVGFLATRRWLDRRRAPAPVCALSEFSDDDLGMMELSLSRLKDPEAEEGRTGKRSEAREVLRGGSASSRRVSTELKAGERRRRLLCAVEGRGSEEGRVEKPPLGRMGEEEEEVEEDEGPVSLSSAASSIEGDDWFFWSRGLAAARASGFLIVGGEAREGLLSAVVMPVSASAGPELRMRSASSSMGEPSP